MGEGGFGPLGRGWTGKGPKGRDRVRGGMFSTVFGCVELGLKLNWTKISNSRWKENDFHFNCLCVYGIFFGIKGFQFMFDTQIVEFNVLLSLDDFFCETDVDAHIYAHTLTPMNARRSYPYEHLRETASKKLHPTGLEIDEVSIDISLLMGTSLLTEKYSAFNETSEC
jgi:hypothetical protein